MYACIYFFLQNKMSHNMTVKINHIDFLHKFVIHIKINILLNVENKNKIYLITTSICIIKKHDINI